LREGVLGAHLAPEELVKAPEPELFREGCGMRRPCRPAWSNDASALMRAGRAAAERAGNRGRTQES